MSVISWTCSCCRRFLLINWYCWGCLDLFRLRLLFRLFYLLDFLFASRWNRTKNISYCVVWTNIHTISTTSDYLNTSLKSLILKSNCFIHGITKGFMLSLLRNWWFEGFIKVEILIDSISFCVRKVFIVNHQPLLIHLFYFKNLF